MEEKKKERKVWLSMFAVRGRCVLCSVCKSYQKCLYEILTSILASPSVLGSN